MQPGKAIESLYLLREEVQSFLSGKSAIQEEWNRVISIAEQQNPWFTNENIIHALESISPWLREEVLTGWLSAYPYLSKVSESPKNIGVVMAGNIPLVGFHDFLCVLLSGNILHAKLSHSDLKLLPFIAERLIDIEPEWKPFIHFVDRLNLPLDGIIATGSNNTARHFEYYFRNTAHIIRRNRNGIALLDGSESPEDLQKLGEDIFRYFGLGCRNVSKLYVPEGYDFSNFFKAVEGYKDVIQHNKYHSNYVYNRTIYLMDGKKFTDNGFLAVINSPAIPSPIAVLNFEEYKSVAELKSVLIESQEQIQCVVSGNSEREKLAGTKLPFIGFGETQSPGVTDYADGVDVMKFCCSLSRN